MLKIILQLLSINAVKEQHRCFEIAKVAPPHKLGDKTGFRERRLIIDALNGNKNHEK